MIIAKYLLVLSILVVVSSLTLTIYARGNITATEELKFLAIQHAQSGSISQINDTAYYFELNDVSDKTILFSNRPDRIVQTETIDSFIGNWSIGEDNFQVDPPNAFLVALELHNQKEDTFVIELFNPEYDKDRKMLKFDFIFLGNGTTSFDLPDVPRQLGKTILLVDSAVTPWADG